MKKFYVTIDGVDVTTGKSIVEYGDSLSLELKGNVIYYLEEAAVQSITNYSSLVEVFSDDAFNSLRQKLDIISIVSILPVSPVDKSWYLISALASGSLLPYRLWLAYYDSSDLIQNWKYLCAPQDLEIRVDGAQYKCQRGKGQLVQWNFVKQYGKLTVLDNLTSSGSSDAVVADSFNCGSVQYTISGIQEGDITLRVEGSLNSTQWYNTGADVTISVNGTYSIDFNIRAKFVRFTFVSQSGTEVITVAPIIYLSRNI